MSDLNFARTAPKKTCTRCGKEFILNSPVYMYVYRKGSSIFCGENCYVNRKFPVEDVLLKARITYGNNNQITVAMEELAELIAVLAKYPRYNFHGKALEELSSKALDEIADVYIVLEHAKAIFELSDEKVQDRMNSKLNRLDRWLKDSDNFEQTTKDRNV